MFPVKFTSEQALDLSKMITFKFVSHEKGFTIPFLCVDHKREVSELSQVTHVVTFVKG